MSTSNTSRFNAEAEAWDSNPYHHLTSSLALKALLKNVPSLSLEKPVLDVLEIGCGTGLLSTRIAPYVRSLTAVDAAGGMVSALQTKLMDSQRGDGSLGNVRAIHVMLEDPDDEVIRPDPARSIDMTADTATLAPRRFDLIISHLVLHHIPSLPDLFKTMFGCLKRRGQVALTDFEHGPQSRKFHPEDKMEGVERHGIVASEIEESLTKAGFSDARCSAAFTTEKATENESGKVEMMDFPFLICIAQKP